MCVYHDNITTNLTGKQNNTTTYKKHKTETELKKKKNRRKRKLPELFSTTHGVEFDELFKHKIILISHYLPSLCI